MCWVAKCMFFPGRQDARSGKGAAGLPGEEIKRKVVAFDKHLVK